MPEHVLAYDRANVRQETGYWCGPASIQTVLVGRGVFVAERDIASQTEALEGNVGWDDQDGTDSITQVAAALNGYLDGGYEVRSMPNDPPTRDQADRLWSDIVASIDAGFGVVVNIDAPPSNYPRGVKGSASPAYGGGRVFHYFAVMGYDDERAVWIADSGFRPYGYWMSFDQLATLIPPKGYTAFTAAKGAENMPADIPAGLTPEVLADAMGRSVALERYRDLFPAVVEALVSAECTTVDRVAMWMAQVGHESAGLKYMREIATGEEYEGRRDLGNTVPGDGVRFAGRGPIQITGRHNYAALSAWAAGRGFVESPTFFVDNPEALESDRYGFMGVTWYWTVARDMNSYADRGDIEGATRAVNGGLNGYQDRVNRWNRCRALGTDILPEGDDMPSADDIAKAVWAHRIRKPNAVDGENLDGRDNETAGNMLAWTDLHAGVGVDQDGGQGSKDRRDGSVTGWDQLGGRSLVDAVAAIGVHLGLPGFKAPGGGK